MKSPNEFNIDEWLFHYFEGDLTPEDETMLEEFLLEHPQYDQDFEAWGASRIQQEAFVYPNQEKLIKPLIHPAWLHRVAVISAIGINALLAGFIIFGSRENVENYNYVKLKMNDERVELSTQSNPNQEDSKNASTIFPKPNAHVYEPQVSASGFSIAQNNNADSRPLNSSEQYPSTITNRESSVFSGSNSTTPNHDNFQQTNDFALESDGLENTYNASLGQNKKSSTETGKAKGDLNKNHHASSEDLKRQRALNNTSNLGDTQESKENRSSETRERDSKESNSREIKLGFNNNRWKRQNVLLTNTRSQEYLIPGANRNQINFGHVGSDFSNSAYLNSYVQYPGRDNQLLSNQLGYDMYIPQLKSGLGIQFMYSTLGNGSVKDFETSLTYSPKIALTKDVIFEPAVRFRMSSTGVDRSQLNPGTWIEFDRMNAFQYTQEHYDAFVSRSIQQDLGLGFLVNSKWGFIGANADHLFGSINQALHYGMADEMQRAPVFLNAVIGTEYESRNKKLLWSGQLVYQHHGMVNRIWFGSRIKYNYLSLGASVSSMGEPMFSAGFTGKGLSLLYSTDYSYSRMYNDKFFSHQLLLRVTLKESRMKKLMLN